MNCNFPILDDPIAFSKDMSNVLIIEDINVYSKIVYSLYQYGNEEQPDYPFIIFDDNFNQLSDFIVVLNPLIFDFNTVLIKKALFSHIVMMLDMDELQKIENIYNQFYQYFNQLILENIEFDIYINDMYKVEDILKMLKTGILDNTSSIFERTQLILRILHELSKKELIIFCGLGTLLSEEDYNFVIEAININQQKVLFIENSKIGSLKNVKEINIDKDYFHTEKML